MNVTRNVHYTFKYNSTIGRHGWLRLTPAYSVRLVEEILDNLDYVPLRVFDPFSGTGTTGLVCANRGIPSYAIEINPFLVWLGNAKLKKYSYETVNKFIHIAQCIIIDSYSTPPCQLPPIHNIHRWWNPPQANFLAKIQAAINKIKDIEVHQLLTITFCRLLIELSNAAFNHVSTSFREKKQKQFILQEAYDRFMSICKMIVSGVSNQPIISSKVLQYDARSIPSDFIGKYDTIITSPPYPNRISYIRELRPYMYWLGYLMSASQASELDWVTIGGTWGKATSLLGTWKNKFILPKKVYNIAYSIANAENKSSGLMGNYVIKYFEDIKLHLTASYLGLMSGGKVFYIIGNSTFYGITVPSETIYIDIMEEIGYRNIEFKVVRKRNSNKKLFEFIITAQKA